MCEYDCRMLLAHWYSNGKFAKWDKCTSYVQGSGGKIQRWEESQGFSDDRLSTRSNENEEENSVTTYSPDSRDSPYADSLDYKTSLWHFSLHTEREKDGLGTQTQSDIQKVALVLFTQRRQIWVMWKLRQNWHLQWILSPGQWHTYSVATSTGCFTCFQCIRKGRQEGMLARELGNIECVVREAGGSSLRTLGKELCDIKCTMATTEEGQKEHAQKL